MSFDEGFVDRRPNLYAQYLAAEQEAIEHYENDPLAVQRQALAEAAENQELIDAPLSGVLDVVTSVRVIPVPEETVSIPVPEGCVSKEDLANMAPEFGVSPRAVGTAWTRLQQRAVHTFTVQHEGVTPGVQAKLDELSQAGIPVYSHTWEGRDESTMSYYAFKDKNGRDVELMRLHDGVTEDNPYYDVNERFLIADAFVKAVDEGWLERVNDDGVVYAYGLGPKYKRLFKGLAERLREEMVEAKAEDLSLGYSTLEDIWTFAAKNGLNASLVPRIANAIKFIARDGGMVSRYVIEHGEFPTRQRDLLESDVVLGGAVDEDEIANVELLTADNRVNLDTLKEMCFRGTFKELANSTFSYGDKTDDILWKFIKSKRKEAIEADAQAQGS